ncbi:hypothetical protein [Nocardia aurantiaca]|uniref:Uncharacterized protein n=1 Tax=Nocardia aurantiaca TaxID=2675850 RepID=A0A6I3KV33_9NOCA|nr:hypothetical protein [Nocardia aurantiaca]MTE13832.1 hypothetical protein [Nocardia aurantiaca]
MYGFEGGNETLDTCGIAELAAAMAALSESVLHGNLTPFTDGEVVDLMQRLEIRQLEITKTSLSENFPAPQSDLGVRPLSCVGQ